MSNTTSLFVLRVEAFNEGCVSSDFLIIIYGAFIYMTLIKRSKNSGTVKIFTFYSRVTYVLWLPFLIVGYQWFPPWWYRKDSGGVIFCGG